MSQENVEIVRDSFRRFSDSDVDEGADLWHPDSRMVAPEGWPEPGPFEGRDAVFAQFRRLRADWGQQGIAGAEVLADRGEWVVATFCWEARGGVSGAATEARFAAAYRIKDGSIREAHFCWTAAEALEAAGLRE